MANKKIRNATITSYNNITFKSKLECNVAKILDSFNIPYHYEEMKFILQDTFKYQEESIRAITYTPDFIIGNIIIECKGYPSDSWKIKRKLFLKILKEKYPEFCYKEIYSIKDLLSFMETDDRFITYNIRVKRLNGSIVGEYNSVSEAMESLNLEGKCRGNINSCLIGTRSKAFNYVWERVESVFIPFEGEIWKDVVGFEGLYYVSSFGRVASAQFHNVHNFRLMSLTDIDGYKFVKLRDWRKGVYGSYAVHRLVAEAFIPNIDIKPQVDHIDTNPSNNNITNLRWVTQSENQHNPITEERLRNHMISMNKNKIGPKASAEKKKKIVIFNNGISLVKYSSISEASRKTGLSTCSIQRWCNRRIKGWSYE